MCGIVGIADYSKFGIGDPEWNAFFQMLVADTARGLDGTGIIKILESGHCDWRKSTGNPFDLLRRDGVEAKFIKKMLSKQFGRWLIGHNRWATKGGVSDSTAHPFTHGKITLIHNGTVSSPKCIPELDDFAVDSEAICKAVDSRGIEKVLQEIVGPYAIVFYDSKAKTLNAVRNYGRPLYLAINPNTHRVMFGSEKEMLEWVASRNNWTMNFGMIPEHTLLTWTLPSSLFPSAVIDPSSTVMAVLSPLKNTLRPLFELSNINTL